MNSFSHSIFVRTGSVLLLVSSLICTASAQITMEMVENRYDKNGDGKVTRSEYSNSDQNFQRLDTDGDGVISSKDFADSGGNRSGKGMNRSGKGKGGGRSQKASWKMDPVSGPNLSYKTFQSESAGEEVSYVIYLPPGYDSSQGKAYPVVYWLHGIGGSQRGVPQICANITKQIENGDLEPFLVVFANGMIDSMYCDAINADVPVESMIINDLIPHIDETYHTKTDRLSRMIEGFSMGGFGAARLGFKYPELFGSISIIDGAVAELDSFSKRHSDLYERIFDSNPEIYNEAHPFSLLKKNKDQIRDVTVIRVAVGKLVPYNQRLNEELDQAGIEHEYEELNQPHSPNPVYDALGEKNWEFYNHAFRR